MSWVIIYTTKNLADYHITKPKTDNLSHLTGHRTWVITTVLFHNWVNAFRQLVKYLPLISHHLTCMQIISWGPQKAISSKEVLLKFLVFMSLLPNMLVDNIVNAIHKRHLEAQWVFFSLLIRTSYLLDTLPHSTFLPTAGTLICHRTYHWNILWKAKQCYTFTYFPWILLINYFYHLQLSEDHTEVI